MARQDFHLRRSGTSKLATRGVMTLAALLLSACSSSKGPVAAPGPWTGPSVQLATGSREHVTLVNAPSAGWQVTLDQVREVYKARRVFITIRQPDPTQTHAQMIVELRVGTTVPAWENVEVWARQVGFDAGADELEDLTYALAADAKASVPVPADVTLPGRK